MDVRVDGRGSEPQGRLDPGYSSADAVAPAWAEAEALLAAAELF